MGLYGKVDAQINLARSVQAKLCDCLFWSGLCAIWKIAAVGLGKYLELSKHSQKFISQGNKIYSGRFRFYGYRLVFVINFLIKLLLFKAYSIFLMSLPLPGSASLPQVAFI